MKTREELQETLWFKGIVCDGMVAQTTLNKLLDLMSTPNLKCTISSQDGTKSLYWVVAARNLDPGFQLYTHSKLTDAINFCTDFGLKYEVVE